MKLKVRYSKKEEVPEKYLELYVERDGEWHLDADGIEDVSGLKSALGKERTRANEAEKALKVFKDAGIDDPQKAAEAIQLSEKLSKLDPTKDLDKIAAEKAKVIVDQAANKHATEKAKLLQEHEGTQKQLEKLLIDNAAISAITAAKGSTDLLLPLVRQQCRMRKLESGQHIVEIIGADGNPRIGDAQGNLMTIGMLVEEMKGTERFGRAFDGSGASGSGGSGGSGSGGDGKVRKIKREDASRYVKELSEGTVEIVD